MTNAAFPDAIILACWPSEDPLLKLLDADRTLISMGDKPMLQRVLERLIDLGCMRIAVIHGNQREKSEELLGDGERWGCKITHHNVDQGSRPLRPLARLGGPRAAADDSNCMLATADTVALTELSLTRPSVACSLEAGELQWSGWAVLPGKAIRSLAETAQNRRDLGRRIVAALDLSESRQLITTTISTASVAATLDSLPRLFALPPGAQGISRRARAEGVWIGNGSRVHPSARLRPPVFIGQNVLVAENAEVGPNAMVGDGCIIDIGSRIEGSMLLPDTYVGQKLEVARSMLAGNQLVNARLGVAVRIPDPEFLRDIKRSGQSGHRVSLTQRALAAILWLVLVPLGVLRWLKLGGGTRRAPVSIGIPGPIPGVFRECDVRLAMTHEDVQRARQGAWHRHFFSTFLPGLADVVAGKVALVGLQPRSARDILSLPYYWQRLYGKAPIGLVSEALLHGSGSATFATSRAAAPFAAGRLPLLRVVRVLGRYAVRVMTEVFTSKPRDTGTSRKTASHSSP